MSKQAFEKIKSGLDEAIIIAPYVAEIERLRAENAKVRSLLRWDIVEDEEGLIICDGDHEKGEKCDHRRLYWQSTVDALRAENEKLREAKHSAGERITGYINMIEQREAEIEKLRAALQPFAGMAAYCYRMGDSESQCVQVGDLRAAAAALKEDGDE